MSLSTNVQTRIKQAREGRGLTQTDLAEMVGANHASTISHYENGKRTPTIDRLSALAWALDVDVGYLIGYECPRCGWRPHANHK